MNIAIINKQMLRCLANAKAKSAGRLSVRTLPGYTNTSHEAFKNASSKEEALAALDAIVDNNMSAGMDPEDMFIPIFFYQGSPFNKYAIDIQDWAYKKAKTVFGIAEEQQDSKNQATSSSTDDKKSKEDKTQSSAVSNYKVKIPTSDEEARKISNDISSCIIAFEELINKFVKNNSPDELLAIKKTLSWIVNQSSAMANAGYKYKEIDNISAFAAAMLANINIKRPDTVEALSTRCHNMYRAYIEVSDKSIVINNILAENDAMNTAPSAAKDLKFSINNFIKQQLKGKPSASQQPIAKVNAVKQTAERKIFNPRPDNTLEDKVKELKTYISFGPSNGKTMTEDQINAMVGLFIDGKGFKRQMKKMGCKANLNTIHLTEVPHDKYEGIDDKFDMVFEVPTNKASNPIVIMYCSTPEWNEQIGSFVSSRDIKMASEMKLSKKKKDKKPQVSEKKLESQENKSVA